MATAVLCSDDGPSGMIFESLPPNPALVMSVVPNSWAAGVGIEPGDKLVKLDDTVVENMSSEVFMQSLDELRPVALTFARRCGSTPTVLDTGSDEGKKTTSESQSNRPHMKPSRKSAAHGGKKESSKVEKNDAHKMVFFSGAGRMQHEIFVDEKKKQMQMLTFVLCSKDGPSGIVFESIPPSPVIVKSLVPNSWAAGVGVEPGDELVVIEDTVVEKMSPELFMQSLDGLRPVALTFARQARDTPESTGTDFTGIDSWEAGSYQ